SAGPTSTWPAASRAWPRPGPSTQTPGRTGGSGWSPGCSPGRSTPGTSPPSGGTCCCPRRTRASRASSSPRGSTPGSASGSPGTDRVVQATFPDGTEPEWKFRVGPRQTLAEWVTAPANPYFARATVNRVWAQFFGVGLVEPVDDMTGAPDTVSECPEVLDELAKAFVAHKYDLRFLVEAIVSTRAYQLSSRGRSPAAPLFSRHRLRGLTAEQLYDSLAVATGQPDTVPEHPFVIFRGGSPRQEFLTKFGQQTGRPVDTETSIIQALTLMNGNFVGSATDPNRSELLGSVLEAPFLDDRGRVETLYLAALSRFPSPQETDRA